MICARASINADTGASLFYISFAEAEAEYFQTCTALAHLNPSANSNKFELVRSNFEHFMGFTKLEYAEEMISFYENNYLHRLNKDTKPKIIKVTCTEEN